MRPGYVYLMRRASDGAHKIGRSEIPGQRRWQVQAVERCEVALVWTHATEDMVGLESYLHRSFKRRRLGGEWFALTERDLRRVEFLAERYRPLFPRFRRWFAEHPEAAARLPVGTRSRYANGALPAKLMWFARHPEMLEALARDVERLTPEKRERMREMFAKARREKGER